MIQQSKPPKKKKKCVECGKEKKELNIYDTCFDCEAWREFTWRQNISSD